MTSNKEFKARIVNVRLKKHVSCKHIWRSLWDDYYSWGSECIKCGLSESGDY